MQMLYDELKRDFNENVNREKRNFWEIADVFCTFILELCKLEVKNEQKLINKMRFLAFFNLCLIRYKKDIIE
jgi:hypothetical protein